jgi:beta-glucosidase
MLVILMLIVFVIISTQLSAAEKKSAIYHSGWIDLNKNGRMDPYENPKLDIEKRIDDLLGRMNIEEKTCQMATLYGYGRVLKDEVVGEHWYQEFWKDGIANIDQHLDGRHGSQYAWPPSKHLKIIEQIQKFFIEDTRLGIPVDFTSEGIHGASFQGATCFPVPPGIGSTWNVELVKKFGHVTGREARAAGFTNVYAPILDLARDARWGRNVECFTEDPYLASRMGVAMVKGLQAEGVASTPKHFAVYSMPKGGRDGKCRTDPHVSPREVENVLNAPFKAAFMEGGALGTMSSYNDYDGIPITGSKEYLIKKLRQEWGFKGYVVSDSKAVVYIFEKHHVADSYKEAVRMAVEAGLNVRTSFNPPEVFANPLRELIREGKISMETIDSRVRDVLRVKYLLGLFDRPYLENPESADEIVRCKEHLDVSLEASRQSIVLLKNENNTLPLSKKIKSILVAGPLANSKEYALSNYGPHNGKEGKEIEEYKGHEIDVISVLEGIEKKLGNDVVVKYAKGCEIADPRWPESEIFPEDPNESERAAIQEAVEMAKTVDVAVVVLGGKVLNYAKDKHVTVCESHSRTSLDLPGFQRNLVKAIYETKTPTVVVLMNGRAVSINWINKYVPAIVETWFAGEKGGQAIAEVLFGDYNPGGKLPVTFPKTVGQIPLNFPYKRASHAGSHFNVRIKGSLYPFGYGLSYTKFGYENLEISPERQGPKGKVKISFDVKNIGGRTGDEVVQLYISDQTSSVTAYEKVLRGFERITLEPGQKQKVTFTLGPEDLCLLDRNMEWVVEPGIFEVMVGSSSEDIRLKGSFEIVK